MVSGDEIRKPLGRCLGPAFKCVTWVQKFQHNFQRSGVVYLKIEIKALFVRFLFVLALNDKIQVNGKTVKLADFGLARRIRAHDAQVNRNRINMTCCGTNVPVKDVFSEVRKTIYLDIP